MIDINVNTLGYYVDRTFTAMVRYLNYALKQEGLDIQHPHYVIMMVVSHNEGINQSEISRYIDRDRASVSRNLNYLEKKGYLERRFDGGCKNLIYLTEKGKRIMPKLIEISEADTNNTLKGFSPKKSEEIFKILTKMYINISSSTPEND